ncbi:MAG: type II secretion system F family protein [Acidobacteriota bacterium]
MEFVCRVGTAEGKILERPFEATDETALRQDLERRGFHVFEVRRKGLELNLPFIGKGPKKIPANKFLIFNQELAALLKAGLPLLQALDLMLERMEDAAFRPVLAEVRERVRSGEDLSEIFAGYGDRFPRLYAPTLKAGERSGELEAVIRRFIRYQTLVLEARRRTVSALVYPAVLVGLSIVMILVVTFYVVPKFSTFFESMDTELPWVTRALLGASGFAAEKPFLLPNGTWMVLAVVAGFWAIRRWSRLPSGAEAIDRWKLRLPLVGQVLRLFSLSEFCRSLATLLSGGMPLVPALEISVSAVGNASVRSGLEPNIQKVREGEPFYAALEASGVFPAMAIDMIKVGESTGSLDEMLTNVSDLFDQRVETRLQRILTLIEPLMLVFLGVIIAILLISIYLPLFGAMGSVT